MKIQILGSGCPTCQKLQQLVKQVVSEKEIEADVEYLSGSQGAQKIMELGAMSSPVLIIDGKIAATGPLSKEKIIAKLTK